MPQISVIVPVYKVEKYLDRCVESILAQTFRDFELILVDDGSPDNCPKMCDEWATKDNRITVIHKSNGGLSDARNAALDWVFENSDSQWVTFIDSDDWVHRTYLEVLYNCVIKNDVKVSICGFLRTDGEISDDIGKTSNEVLMKPEVLYVENDTNFTIACGKLYKKELFNSIRYPVDRLHEDEFTTYKILMPLSCIVYVQKELYFYYQNQSGITHCVNLKRIEDLLQVSNEQLDYFHINGYESALNRSIWAFMWTISSQIEKAKTNQSDKDEIEELQRIFKKYLRKCRRFGSIEFSKCAGVYERIYPKRMYIYWTYKAIVNRIKGVFKK